MWYKGFCDPAVRRDLFLQYLTIYSSDSDELVLELVVCVCGTSSVQKRVNKAGLRLLSLERPAGKVDLWLASGI